MESKPLELPQQWKDCITKEANQYADKKVGDLQGIVAKDVLRWENTADGYEAGANSRASWLYTCQENYKLLKAKVEVMEKALKEMEQVHLMYVYQCANSTASKHLINIAREAMKPLVKLSCMVCKKEYFDTEPQTCCSGSDCGCGGWPIEPIVCSEECYNALPGIRSGEALKGKEGEDDC